MNWNDEMLQKSKKLRKVALKATLDRRAGYLGQVCSSAEILTTMLNVANIGPSVAPMVPPALDKTNETNGGAYYGEKAPEYDRIVNSAAHYALGIYSALIADGRLSEEALLQLNNSGTVMEQIGDDHSPGFEVVSGSFGQIMGQAGGIAMARRRRNEAGKVMVFMADGELEEGSTWESIQAISNYKLDNVIVFVDVNGMQADGHTKDVMNIEPISGKLLGFGCDVFTVNGHDPKAIRSAVESHEYNGRPTFVLCYTNMETGIEAMKGRDPRKLHFVSINKDEYDSFLNCYETM